MWGSAGRPNYQQAMGFWPDVPGFLVPFVVRETVQPYHLGPVNEENQPIFEERAREERAIAELSDQVRLTDAGEPRPRLKGVALPNGSALTRCGRRVPSAS